MHLCIHGNKIPAECGSCFPKNIHDFCSQFVAEVLSKSGAVKLKKKESLYLPGQLVDGMECLFSQKQIVYNAI